MDQRREQELRAQAVEMGITLAVVFSLGLVLGAGWQYLRTNYKQPIMRGGVTSTGFTWHYDPSGNGGAIFEPKGEK